MKKYAIYGNEKMTALKVAKDRGVLLDECIFCPDGKQQAENCGLINQKLKIVGPEDGQ